MPQYIKVAEDEGDEPIEVPCEEDSTVLLTTLTSLFPGASGIKYRHAESGAMRGLRMIDGKIQAPEEGWEKVELYYCCFPKENKRKMEDSADTSNTKTKRIEEKKKVSDLIVLGLPWKTTDKELKEYFEQFGELLMAQVKRDPRTGESKGFGFIRFADYESQKKVTVDRHNIGGRFCDVRVPMSKDGMGGDRTQEASKKIFIGRLTEAINYDDLKDYFSKYGEILDIFIPKPFRGFAFVTFREIDVAQTLFGEDHIIKGISVHVSTAVPKFEMHHQGYNGKPYGRYPSGGGGGGAGGGAGPYANSYGSPGPHHGATGHHHHHLDISQSSHHSASSGGYYDHYSRNRSGNSQYGYHDSGASTGSNVVPYNRYSSQYSSASDYPPYY